MAFSDPITIDFGGGPVSLPRIQTSSGNGIPSRYQAANGTLAVSASSNYGRRTRQVLRLDSNKVTPDPFIPSNSVKVAQSMYIVFDRPPVGFDNAEELGIFTGFVNMITANSNGLIVRLLGGES